MFELPEMVCLSEQINQAMTGKIIREGSLGNSPHKFVWYNRSHTEFAALTKGKTIGQSNVRGRWMFLPLDPGYVLVLGECGGKILFHPAGTPLPGKYHLALRFDDDTLFTVTTQMWGAMELYIRGEELQRDYIHNMRPTPLDDVFTPDYFRDLVHDLSTKEKRSVKSLLTQDQLIPGLGNSIAQDIMFHARLHPRHSIQELSDEQIGGLFESIIQTLGECISHGGRADETNLYKQPGGYQRLMDKASSGQPCPVCGTTIQSMQYLGGSCYFCPKCQT